MKTVELTPKAAEDMESIWLYSYDRYGETKADEYIDRISMVLKMLISHEIGASRPELGKNIFSIPAEQHVIFFVSHCSRITVIRILSHAQDALRHLAWY
ncbi:type II toxin-antitoxin system RelE/ParE family toxin [Dryocola clanedunensis]|uniref:type II toxin-antitoxin system RelE/ParE family toxin n=1 Tax=Cedecea sulfonylureivorans TaxID=3051154 RepID=UPI0019286336|nr:type II toxin-antitoxin system RelE/ParE family toxin [Cedecea sulfonylureivorans]